MAVVFAQRKSLLVLTFCFMGLKVFLVYLLAASWYSFQLAGFHTWHTGMWLENSIILWIVLLESVLQHVLLITLNRSPNWVLSARAAEPKSHVGMVNTP